MLGPVREVARTLLAFAETRARLAATELEEQAARLAEILVWLAAAVFLLGLGLVLASVAIVLAFWNSNPLFAAGLLAALYVGAGATAALIARARMRERPRFLAATLAELEKDRERVTKP